MHSKDNLFKWILSKGTYTLGLKVTAMVITLGFVSIMSIFLTKADYGAVVTLMSASILVAAFSGLGQQEFMVREISQKLDDGEVESAEKSVVLSTSWVSISGLLFGCILSLGLFIAGFSPVLALCGLPLVFFLSLNQCWAGFARAREKFFWSLAPLEIFWRSGVIIAIGFASFIGFEANAEQTGILLIMVLSVAVISQASVLKIQPSALISRPHLRKHRLRVRSSIDFATNNISIVLTNLLDVVLVGVLISEVAAAEYFPANRLALVTAFVSTAMTLVIGPKLAVALKQANHESIYKITTIATSICCLATLIFGFSLIFLYDYYSFLFPTVSQATFVALTILVSVQVVLPFFGFGQLLLAMSGHEALLRKINIVFLIVGSALLYTSTFFQDFVLVAIASSSILITRRLVFAILAYAKTGVYPFCGIFNMK